MDPICPKHFARMLVYCTTRSIRYYRCQVDHCSERLKLIRTHGETCLSQPAYCENCGEAMQLTERQIATNGIEMICPECSRVQLFLLAKIS